MFGMGWNEILVVMLLAVVVIGPKHLPEVAKGVGKMMAYFRRASNDLRDAVNSEIAEHDEAKELKDFTNTFDKEMFSVKRAAKDYVDRQIDKEDKELRDMAGEVKDAAKSATGELESAAAEAPNELEERTKAMADAAVAMPSESSVMRPTSIPQETDASATENAADTTAASSDDPADEPEKKVSAS